MSKRDSSLNPHRSFIAATSSSNRAVYMKSSKLAASFFFVTFGGAWLTGAFFGKHNLCFLFASLIPVR